MNRSKGIQWLYDELADLVSEGVVDDSTAHRLHDHYGPVKVKSRSDLLIIIFSVVGASFIGLGIILVLASNWDQLGRPVRAVISITPLVISQLICAWVLLKKTSRWHGVKVPAHFSCSPLQQASPSSARPTISPAIWEASY